MIIQVQLLGELKEENTFAVVAIANTPPLTIRGRSTCPNADVKQPQPLQKINNLDSYLNMSQYVPSPLSQSFLRCHQENTVPYSDGILQAIDSIAFSDRPASNSWENIENTTFFNTVDKQIQLDPFLCLPGDDFTHLSSSSFSDDYFLYSEGYSDITPLPDKPCDTCVEPQLVFKE